MQRLRFLQNRPFMHSYIHHFIQQIYVEHYAIHSDVVMDMTEMDPVFRDLAVLKDNCVILCDIIGGGES